MPRALVLGGTGLVGRAVARRLLGEGWQVDLTGRDPGHLPDDDGGDAARRLGVRLPAGTALQRRPLDRFDAGELRILRDLKVGDAMPEQQ